MGDTEIGPFRLSDVDGIIAAEDGDIRRAFPLGEELTAERARGWIETAETLWLRDDPNDWWFAVRSMSDEHFIGSLRMRRGMYDHMLVECWVAPQDRRAGHARRTLELGCQYAFCDRGEPVLEAEIRQDNSASPGLAIAVGFTLMEGEWRLTHDDRNNPAEWKAVYRLTAHLWKQTHTCAAPT